MIALLFAFLLAQPPKDEPPAKKPDAEREKKTEPDQRPFRQTIQGVTVSIEEVAVGRARLDFLGDKTLSDGEHLLVALVIMNGSETKKLDYLGWNAPFGLPLPYAATVTDEFDNTLKGSAFGFGVKVIGQVQNVSIYPGKGVRDVLAFERPIDKCESVRLLLPGEAIGLDENFVFDIPASAWKPKPRKPPAKAPAVKKAPIKAKPKPKLKDEVEAPIESIVLLSVSGKDESAKALVRLLPSKKTLLVSPGQKIGRWQVATIDGVLESIFVVDPKGERKRLKKVE
jgi:hypothetical protein